jgi:hypothetical protein
LFATLAFYVPFPDSFLFDWIEKYPGCNILLISRETAISVSRVLIHDKKALSTTRIMQIFRGLKSALNLKNISVIDTEPFYLTEVIMPDDDFHRDFADRFYGERFRDLVRFEDIWSRYRKTETKVKTEAQSSICRRLQLVRVQ